MRLTPEQAAIIREAATEVFGSDLLPSPSGRGAGGEGTTLATNRTQPEPSPQPSLGDFRWSSPKGRGSQDSALTRHPFPQAGGSQTPAFRPQRS